MVNVKKNMQDSQALYGVFIKTGNSAIEKQLSIYRKLLVP
jgi:hypothetical protein